MATTDTSIPAWAAGGSNGQSVQSGKKSNWYTASTAKPGYALSGDYWREPAGHYLASVSLAVAPGGANVNVEVWNASANKLLARRVLQHTNGRITVRVPVTLPTVRNESVFEGWGAWSMTPAAPFPGREPRDPRVVAWGCGPGQGLRRQNELSRLVHCPAVAVLAWQIRANGWAAGFLTLRLSLRDTPGVTVNLATTPTYTAT